MMKTMKILSVAMIIASTATGLAKTKATDFNDIIEQNNSAQKAMHSQIKQNMDETQALVATLKAERAEVVVASDENNSINVPTNKDMLKFTKEKQRFQPSRAESDKRLAQELEDMQ